MSTPVVIAGIDTADSAAVTVSVTVGGERSTMTASRTRGRSQDALPMLVALLKEKGLTLADLTGISVNTGPGSYTGIRVGIAVANTLSVMLGIPVNGKHSLATPVYT